MPYHSIQHRSLRLDQTPNKSSYLQPYPNARNKLISRLANAPITSSLNREMVSQRPTRPVAIMRVCVLWVRRIPTKLTRRIANVTRRAQTREPHHHRLVRRTTAQVCTTVTAVTLKRLDCTDPAAHGLTGIFPPCRVPNICSHSGRDEAGSLVSPD
jgi:hypothetical protein